MVAGGKAVYWQEGASRRLSSIEDGQSSVEDRQAGSKRQSHSVGQSDTQATDDLSSPSRNSLSLSCISETAYKPAVAATPYIIDIFHPPFLFTRCNSIFDSIFDPVLGQFWDTILGPKSAPQSVHFFCFFCPKVDNFWVHLWNSLF